tara:strand:+ start:232 stop:339 length:108 start_codon:yes stop_codon:yes gene_type:complete
MRSFHAATTASENETTISRSAEKAAAEPRRADEKQ